MPKGEEVKSVSRQNASSSAQGLEVEKILSSSGHGRSVSLDIPLYRTGHRAKCDQARVSKREITLQELCVTRMEYGRYDTIPDLE